MSAKSANTSKEQNDLIYASYLGNLQHVKDLLHKNIDPDTENKFHITPLYTASEQGHLKVVEELLKAGADPLKKPEGKVMSFQAAKRAGKDEVATFIVNYKNKSGWTPLHFAVRDGLIDDVKALIEVGANMNEKTKKEQTPLHIAQLNLNGQPEGPLKNGLTQVVNFLTEKGAELLPEIKPKKGGSRSRMTKRKRRSC